MYTPCLPTNLPISGIEPPPTLPMAPLPMFLLLCRPLLPLVPLWFFLLGLTHLIAAFLVQLLLQVPLWLLLLLLMPLALLLTCRNLLLVLPPDLSNDPLLSTHPLLVVAFPPGPCAIQPPPELRLPQLALPLLLPTTTNSIATSMILPKLLHPWLPPPGLLFWLFCLHCYYQQC